MFKRKKPLGLINQFKNILWPENGFKRFFLYYWKRLIRIPESPHSISMGFSIGVFIAFSPLEDESCNGKKTEGPREKTKQTRSDG